MTRDTTSQEYLELKAELRSILISSQQGCSEQQLMKDYAAYNGKKDIPYRDMGYKSLVELLMSMPDVARIDHTRLQLVIHGVADQTTAHIKKMVMTQKRNKKKGNTRGNINRNNFPNNRTYVPQMYSRNRQNTYNGTNNGSHYQPFHQITNQQQNPWDIPNLMANNNNTTASLLNDQNRSISLNKPMAATNTKMVASFPPKTTATPPLISSSDIASIRATPILDDSSSIVDEDLNCSADEELVAYDAQRALEYGDQIIDLRKRIRQLLLRYTSGLWLTSVHKLYKKMFDEELKLEDYKLKTLMAFFDCVSDFVDSRRDGRAESTDRLFLLKQYFIEAAKREQQNVGQSNEIMTSLTNYNDHDHVNNDIDRPIVDLSSFVSLDFQYRSIECTSNEPFYGFLGDVEDPWNIHLGNIQFIPNRDRMMTQLQLHYNQSSSESIYLIPFEQIHIHLCCIYYHQTDKQYYRALIYHIDPTITHDFLVLKLYLVDFGYIISNIPFNSNSTNLRFLHKNFSTLSTQIYNCRLANITYPLASNQWHEDAKQTIVDLCEGNHFQVEIVGIINGFYSIYLWNDLNRQQSINQLLIQQSFAIECDDNQSSEFESIVPKIETNSNYLNEKFFSKSIFEYNIEENHFKYFLINIQHGYYFVKHPFTKRPCLPCFELSRLLNKDEQFISQLNLIRDTELPLIDSYEHLYKQLIVLSESKMCPHLHEHNHQPKIILYDLSSIRDYLYKIKYNDGDILDAFQKEYQDYERPGYWNETKNSYINETNLQTQHDHLNERHHLLNIRKNQLISLSKTIEQSSTHNELHQLNNQLSTIGQELTTMKTILPSTNKENIRMKLKISNMKMRDTLFRIARPFDQQFALNIRFNHQIITNDTFLNEDKDEIEERFSDLARIMKNILQFFLLEFDLSDEKNREFLNQAETILPNLIDDQYLLTKRIDIYNYCLQIIEYFQPIIRSYVQRTDLIDTIY